MKIKIMVVTLAAGIAVGIGAGFAVASQTTGEPKNFRIGLRWRGLSAPEGCTSDKRHARRVSQVETRGERGMALNKCE
jgi:hypothetical protein